jgi:branched-subunit amino acid permease
MFIWFPSIATLVVGTILNKAMRFQRTAAAMLLDFSTHSTIKQINKASTRRDLHHTTTELASKLPK